MNTPRYPSSSSLTRRPERKGPTSGPRSHSQADASKVTARRAKPCQAVPVSNLKNLQGQPNQQQEQREGSRQDPKNEAGLLFNAGMRCGRSHGDQLQRDSMFPISVATCDPPPALYATHPTGGIRARQAVLTATPGIVYPTWHTDILGANAGFLFRCYSDPSTLVSASLWKSPLGPFVTHGNAIYSR